MDLRGYLLVLCAAALWGMLGPISKLAFEAGMVPLEVAFWRIAVGWLLFASQAFLTGRQRVKPADLPPMLVFGVLGVAGLFGTIVLAVHYGGAALAAVLLYTAPAWVALMARLFLNEPMTGTKLLALALTMGGVAAISFGPALTGGGSVSITGPALGFGLASGFCYALYYIFGKRYLGSYATCTLFLYAMPVGALTLLPFFSFSPHPVQAYLAVIALGTLSTFGAYSLYYAGLKHLEATRAAVVATLEPVVAAVLAYVGWHETFSAAGYAGSLCILAGVLITMLPPRGIGAARLAAQGAQRP